jgi:CRISPR-associated protein (TIGR02710 family)
MNCLLLVTVGGSPDPVIFAVQALRREQAAIPVEVVFICSVDPCPKPSLEQVIGDGFPCMHFLPDGSQQAGANLLRQLEITDFVPEQHLVGIPDPDDLADAYQRIRDHIQKLRRNGFRGRIRGDYTGGTKSMSAALAMACVQLGIDIGVVNGPRTNLEKVDQSESTRLMDIAPLHATHQLESQLKPILSMHNYGEAAQLLWQYLQNHGRRISAETSEDAEELLSIVEVQETWDRFQWQEALERAKQLSLAAQAPELVAWWQRVVMARACMDGQAPGGEMTGYELVQDLLLSAERCGRRAHYDDAVARLYRALELLAQTYITLELKITPESNWEKDRCTLLDGTQLKVAGAGITALYKWLEEYEPEQGLGRIFRRRKHQFYELLRARNRSLLAHGFSPLSQRSWTALQADVTYFVDQILKQPGFQQGAPPCQLLGSGLLKLPAAQRLFGAALVSSP